VSRSLPALRGTASRDTSRDTPDVSPVLAAVRALVLVMVLITVPLAEPRPGVGPRGIAVAVALGICTVSWLTWLFARGRRHVVIGAMVVLGAASGALAGLSALSTAIALGCVVTSSVGTRLNIETSLAITAETVAAFLIAGIVAGAPIEALLGYPLTFIGLWAFGLTRHAFLLRAEQAELTLEQTRRAHQAETEAAALAERARIAREIHDVLAHSLAAVSVNLQAAAGLLGELPDTSTELARAIQCIERAGTFTREGMAEARRAILALRDNPVPLADQLAMLAADFRAQGDLAVDFSVTGTPRPVAAETSLTAFRTAQEALTNARKHAPGQPVRLNLEFAAEEITVRVTNPLTAPSAERPLADSGAGYGLAGLRERAALGGGTLTVGPATVEWQVCLKIPV
jgi:signal transduction histidine kinase